MVAFVGNGSAIIYAALIKDRIVGFIWGYCRNIRGEKRIHVTRFVVSEKYRCLGIGTQLLKVIVNYSDENDYQSIELNVSPDNYREINFYVNNGFKAESICLVQEKHMNIYGEKVILRALDIKDTDFLYELINDPDTEFMLGGEFLPSFH